MPQETVYEAGGVRMVGQLFVGEGDHRRPGVLVAHESPGVTRHTLDIAERLASLGYAALALDYQGGGVALTDRDEVMRRYAVFMADPAIIRGRMAAALEALKADPRVDAGRLAAIGYCYGGTAVLELARAGADLQAVAGFHCGLTSARPAGAGDIRGRVLVQVGADDPVVTRSDREAFEAEMTAAGVDWRLNLLGGTGHSFTNPEADGWGMPGFSYHAASDRRAWAAMRDLFAETIEG